MSFKHYFPALLLLFVKCTDTNPGISLSMVYKNDSDSSRPAIISHISLPHGYKRTLSDSISFGKWLGDIKIKKDNKVYLYDGRLKENQKAQFAVLDISTGTKDLQQCADAIMRLRAEYLFKMKRYDEIVFKDYDNKEYRFLPPYNSGNLQLYLQKVFGMCGSASLAKQMRSAEISAIEPGDILIRGGFPGHAVIVLDVASNIKGNKIYLLAQSYMPAQNIHVLINPADSILSPWYQVSNDKIIITPEYIFRNTELKKW
ncbi:MAG: DUF4846 domain-containing protein [Ferruginibacter sp.]